MSKVPFYVGNLAACFVPGSDRRAHTRGNVNLLLYRPKIAKFIKHKFGEKLTSIKFVRQRTLNRVVCLVNDKYYVKIFRDVTNAQLKDFEFLLNYVRARMDVEIPLVIADDHWPMYASPKINGHNVRDFSPADLIKNNEKIKSQVRDIISQLQSINVVDIPNYKRFLDSMQMRTPELPCDNPRQVLAHFDLNESNMFFDDDMNVTAVIDWDTLSVANNPDTDWRIFLKWWNLFYAIWTHTAMVDPSQN